MATARGSRGAGIAILAGGFLFLLATIMHPPVTDPWQGLKVLPHIVESPSYWNFDHLLMLLAILLLFGGLAAGTVNCVGEAPAAATASGLYLSSMTIWIVVLVMELTLFPYLAANSGGIPSHPLTVLFAGLFAYGIVAGDVAMMLAWIAVALTGLALLRRNGDSRGFPFFGIISGMLGVIGIPAMLILPDWSLPILVVTSGPAFVWMMLLGLRLLRRKTAE